MLFNKANISFSSLYSDTSDAHMKTASHSNITYLNSFFTIILFILIITQRYYGRSQQEVMEGVACRDLHTLTHTHTKPRYHCGRLGVYNLFSITTSKRGKRKSLCMSTKPVGCCRPVLDPTPLLRQKPPACRDLFLQVSSSVWP